MNDEIIQIEITIDAMLNLIEMLLYELKLSGNEKIFTEINEITSKLHKIATQEKSASLLAEIKLFQAKMQLVEGNIDEAREFLTKAQDIAEEYGLKRLANEISNEHDSILAQLSKWEAIIEDDVPLQQRIENLNYDFLYSKTVRNFTPDLNNPNEKPMFILIWSNKGLALFEFYFDPSLANARDHIVGILSAIGIVGQEALSTTKSIDRIKFEDKTIIVRVKEQLKFAYAFEGHTYSAIKKLESFMDEINHNSHIWDILVDSELTGKKINKAIHSSIMSIANPIFLPEIH